MSDGTRSNLPAGDQAMQLARIPQNAIIRRVTIFHDPRDHITGLQFFDQNNTNILTAGACDYTPVHVQLEEGERIVGIKSTLFTIDSARHTEFFFVIGRLHD